MILSGTPFTRITPPQHGGVLEHCAFPDAIAEDYYLAGIFLREKRAPQRRRHSELREVIGGD